SSKAKNLKQRIIDNIESTKLIFQEDKLLLSELLESYDKEFFNKFIEYFQGKTPISLLLNNVSQLNNYLFGDYFRFFTFDSTTMGKKQIHNNEALLFSSEFSSKFANKKHILCDYKVKVDLTRSVKKPDKDLKKTFKDMGFNLESIVDLEFFEYRHEQENLNFTVLDAETIDHLKQKYGIIIDGDDNPIYSISKIIYSQPNLNYKDEMTLLEMLKFHCDKEKLHLQFGVFSSNGRKNYIPLYVGIGTNEPYGIKTKGTSQKERFFIMDLLTNNIQLDHNTKLIPSNLNNFFTYIKFNKNYSLVYDIDSYKCLSNGNHSIVFKLIDSVTKKFIKFYNFEVKIIDDKIELGILDLLNNICNGLETVQLRNIAGNNNNATLSFQLNSKNTLIVTLFANNTYTKSLYKININELVVQANVVKINLIDTIKKMLQPSWSNDSYLLNLLNLTDKDYLEYFRLKNNPYKIVSDLDYKKSLKFLNESKGNFFNHTTDSGGNLQYQNYSQMGEDLESISGVENRMKFISILFGSFLKSGDLDDIVLDPKLFEKTHPLFSE
ncbi:MAG: hypothetical protein V3575_05700, partial [Candidatus Absconditabacteria bacterium]